MAWSPDALIIVSHKHSWARKGGEGGGGGEFQVPNGNSEEGWDTFTVTEPEFGGRLHASCFAYTIQSFQQLSEIGYSDPRLIAPIHKSEIISCLSETIKDLVEFSIRTSESNAPVPFLSAYPAFCFLSIAVFFHSVGVLHHLEHRRCLTNVHRMDVEWLNEYCTNACRTRDPHRRVRVKWLSQLSLLLRRGDVHTWGQRTLLIPLMSPMDSPPCVTKVWPLLTYASHPRPPSAFLPENQMCLHKAGLCPPKLKA